MKSRVKATGEIIEVEDCGSVFRHGALFHGYKDANGIKYLPNEIELQMDFDYWEACQDETPDSPDYWTRLEHQAAIAAMQGMLSGDWVEMTYRVVKNDGQYRDLLTNKAQELAHALVEKYKEKEANNGD
jgi:hypothetical protein